MTKEFVEKGCAGSDMQCDKSRVVDRKLDLVVRELKRYGVSVAGIQELKCSETVCGKPTGIPSCTQAHLYQVIMTEQLKMKELE